MNPKRKLPDAATLAAHCAAGLTYEHIAVTYDCHSDVVRRKLQSLGLMACKTKKAMLTERLKEPPKPEPLFGTGPRRTPMKVSVELRPDRTVFIGETPLENGGSRGSRISVARNSMHVVRLIEKFPALKGSQHA